MDNSSPSAPGQHTPDPISTAVGVGPLIRAARQKRRLTLAAVAERVGCARTYLSAVETGRKRPSLDLLAALERALFAPAGSLIEPARLDAAPASVKAALARAQKAGRAARALGDALRSAGGSGALDDLHRTGRLRALIESIDPAGGGAAAGGSTGLSAPASDVLPIALGAEVPLINSVAAGYPTEFTDLGYPARVADEYVRSPDVRDGDAFAARVVGDSMEPAYGEGDIVIFSPARPVKSGMDCFVRLEPDHQTTFKRIFFEDADGKVRLQPLNPRYPARTLDREHIAGLYAAVSVMKAV